MKIENIALGDSVQVKKSLCHSEFKAKQLCEVIDIDLTDKHGFDVLIQGKNCLDWVNHKDLKKYIERDIAKEPLEVDLSSELTGSGLARAMLARGDRWILCGNTTDGFASPCVIDGYRCNEDDLGFVLTNGKSIEPQYIHPVNNQGEPLTAADVGL